MLNILKMIIDNTFKQSNKNKGLKTNEHHIMHVFPMLYDSILLFINITQTQLFNRIISANSSVYFTFYMATGAFHNCLDCRQRE